MTRKKSVTIEEAERLVAKCREAILKGRTAEVMDKSFREELDAWVNGSLSESFEGAAGNGDALKLELQARSAQLHLIRNHNPHAASALRPFVEYSETRSAPFPVNEDELGKLLKRDTISAHCRGLILAQVANYMYRLFDGRPSEESFRVGLEYAKRAHAFLDDPDVDAERRTLAVCQNRIWQARLQWRKEPTSTGALMTLETTISTLREMAGERGGADLLRAIALGLWASISHNEGNLSDAREKIYEALFLLKNEPLSDPVRLAHATMLAGRIEASRASATHTVALRLLTSASQMFRQCEHKFEARALINKAQVLVRCGRYEEAEETLEHLGPFAEQHEDERESALVQAEVILTRLWIAERRAREHNGDWGRCGQLANKLASIDNVPQRIQLEARLHLGISLAHSADRQAQARGLQELRALLGTLVRNRNMRAACHFALVEGLLEAGHRDEVEPAWRKALHAMKEVEHSTFLEDWKSRLGIRVGGIILLDIDSNTTMDDAVRRLKKQMIERALHRAEGDINLAARQLGRAPKYLKDLFKELEIDPQSFRRLGPA